MENPIFNSIINRIRSELNKRNIPIKQFRTWDEDRINASGLELIIDLQPSSDYIKELMINFDWDRFREIALARQLDGMEEHPLLSVKGWDPSPVEPLIDIEVVWKFDEKKTQELVPTKVGNTRLEAASEWMEKVSQEVNELLLSDDIITRWHIEVEGDKYGRYLSAINLISYFQYSLSDLKSLNEVHQYISRKIQHLLFKTNKVIKLSDNTITSVAA